MAYFFISFLWFILCKSTNNLANPFILSTYIYDCFCHISLFICFANLIYSARKKISLYSKVKCEIHGKSSYP